jgi:hypothetical protein
VEGNRSAPGDVRGVEYRTCFHFVLRAMKYGSVKFTDDVGSTKVLFDDDEGAKILRSHLAIE